MDFNEAENEILRNKLKSGPGENQKAISELQDQLADVIKLFSDFMNTTGELIGKQNKRIDDLERRIIGLSK